MKGEFIFMIDRSGSMYGEKLLNTKKSILNILKSLPINSYFNIYCFGSSFSKIFTKSVEFNLKNLNLAITELLLFEADMGGTSLFEPLLDIF